MASPGKLCDTVDRFFFGPFNFSSSGSTRSMPAESSAAYHCRMPCEIRTCVNRRGPIFRSVSDAGADRIDAARRAFFGTACKSSTCMRKRRTARAQWICCTCWPADRSGGGGQWTSIDFQVSYPALSRRACRPADSSSAARGGSRNRQTGCSTTLPFGPAEAASRS